MKTELEITNILFNKLDNLGSLCRVCLSEATDCSVSLFGEHESVPVWEKVMLCARVQILPLDGLPTSVCARCFGDLQAADTFRLKCEYSDSLLRKLCMKEETRTAPGDSETLIRPPSADSLKTESLEIEEWIKMEDGSSPRSIGSPGRPSGDRGKYDVTKSLLKTLKKYSKKERKKHKSSRRLKEFELDHEEDSFSNLERDSVLPNERLGTTKRQKKQDVKAGNAGKVCCDVCNKVLCNKYSLEKHIANMHSEEKKRRMMSGYRGADKRFHCPECSFSALRKFKLLNHLRVHTGEKPFHCEVCGNNFSQKTNLKMHMRTHSDRKEFICDTCGKQFRHKQNYKRHQNVHDNIKDFTCSICNKSLKSPETLKSHMDRHYNIKNYSCETCGMMFVTRVELCNHSKKHSSEKSFQCDVCEFRTRMKKNLVKHIQRHIGLRPFKCELCDNSFFCAEKLRFHMRRHTKEKNYSCPVCQMKFAHSSSVNKHMSRIHGISYKVNDTIDRRIIK